MRLTFIWMLLVTLGGTPAVSADLFDITAPGDPLQGVPDDGDWPGAESPPNAIDNQISGFKYLHFKGDFVPDPGTGGTGFRVTPSGPHVVVTHINLATANDTPGRDPIAFRLSGSNDSINGPYTLIAEGTVDALNEAAEYPRDTWIPAPIAIENTQAYLHYELIFTAIRGPVGGSVNSMQIAEVELLSDGTLPGAAGGPIPPDGETDVRADVVLQWAPGAFAATHNVFLGTDFDEVNDATPADAAYRGTVTDAAFTPGLLTYGTTYYWRVDEVNAPPHTSTVFRGKTWSFTVEPLAFPVPVGAVQATASSGSDPNNLVNGSGLNESDQHSNLIEAMWTSDATDAAPWVLFTFDTLQKLNRVHVWNHNSQTESILGFGIKEAQIEISRDGTNWTDLGTLTVPQATGTADYSGVDIPMEDVVARYVRVSPQSNYSLLGLAQKGLAEVRFYALPMRARRESPADGTTGVAPLLDLSWRAGREAAQHDVWIGTDPNALAQITTVNEPAYAASVGLDSTVYWRIDEVNDAGDPVRWSGPTWSFTTNAFVTIDDMESYQSRDGAWIWETWADGFEDSANGALLGHGGDDMETDIVYEGAQSLPFAYGQNNAPHSEASRPIDRDWGQHGIVSLSLMFFGQMGNVPGTLYLKVNGTRIADYPTPADLTLPQWQVWTVDLPAAARGPVQDLTLGIDGGSGLVFIDAIRLYAQPSATLSPVDPHGDGLVASYPLDGTYQDASGNGHDGVPVNNPLFLDDPARGQVLTLDGLGACVDIGPSASFNFPGSFSLSAWAQIREFTATWGHVLVGNRGENNVGWQLRRHSSSPNLSFTVRGTPGPDDPQGTVDVTDFVNEWLHVTAVYDMEGGARTVYVNGLVDVSVADANTVAPAAHTVYIGARANAADTDVEGAFDGFLSDVRIYGRALSQAEALSLAGRQDPIFKPF